MTVRIESLRKTFKGKREVVAIDDLDLELEPGELLVLLGPSGCGKTTTLRAIAGLDAPDAGRISIGGRVVFDAARRVDVATEKRHVGMVFQSYALWPHKTVRANIEYPLRARHIKDDDGAVEAAAAVVDCADLLDRYPAQLSGGQQQRVAVARGIVARPEVVLLDEPLSNLDARLRDQVRGELHELHRRLGFTAVYVTHDQTEALALGDRLAVMRAGAIEQLGPPSEIYHHPATEYVAGFVGFLNQVVVRRDGEAWRTTTGPLEARLKASGEHAEVRLRIRPDDVAVLPAGERATDRIHLDGARVVGEAYMGRHLEVLIDAGGARWRANVPSHGTTTTTGLLDHDVTLAFPAESALTFDADGRHADVKLAPH
jgi:iron(III) transport system ATP-binding protein